jgi:hypothetical protein
MSQVPGSQGPQAPQLSEEEKQKVIDNIGMGFVFVEIGLMHVELLMMGCLTPPESSTLDTWKRWAEEALDRNDMDKAVEWTRKIIDFLEQRQKLCDRLMRKNRRYNKRHSSRH